MRAARLEWFGLPLLVAGVLGCDGTRYGVNLQNRSREAVFAYGVSGRGEQRPTFVGAGKTEMVYIGESGSGEPEGIQIVVLRAKDGRQLAELPVSKVRGSDGLFRVQFGTP